MSGPLGAADASTDPAVGRPSDDVAVLDDRTATVGAISVRRALPRRGRRTVGAWCFADHMGPEQVTETQGLDIGPHPHIGLHTVTCLVEGAVLHRDSLGSEQVIRPGQLNLMTAGRGVAHAEEAVDGYRGTLHGVQLWVAMPEATRHGDPAFEHQAELPEVEVGGATARLLLGSFAGATSPARTDSELLGAELDVRAGASEWPLVAEHEHALVVLEGEVAVGDHLIRPGQLGYVGPGRDALALTALSDSRVLLLGGLPFGEQLVMWWNFVGRSRSEIASARDSWSSPDGRFGDVDSRLDRIDAPPLV
jgi:redox-sensitive bicupin YhaK (pirin superfamily)